MIYEYCECTRSPPSAPRTETVCCSFYEYVVCSLFAATNCRSTKVWSCLAHACLQQRYRTWRFGFGHKTQILC